MRWKKTQVALLIGIAALATQVVAAPATEADANKINAILDRWQVVEASKGGDVALWRDMMSIQLKLVSPTTLDRLLALNTGPSAHAMAEFYQTFIYTLATDISLRLQAQQAQKEEAKTVTQPGASDTAGEPTARNGMAERVDTKALGSVGFDQTFTPITPCRVVDTRNLGGPIGAFATRNFFFFTTSASTNWNSIQGGVNGAAGTVCPGTVITGYTPSAAVATVTVTGQGGAGNLIVWQGTNPVASASTMSYFASGDIASLAVVPGGGRSGTGPGGAVEDFGVFVNAFTATNVVVDIVGYYTQPAATALQCTYPSTAGTGTFANGSQLIVALPACAAGYTRTGSGCQNQFPFNTELIESAPAGFTDCVWANNSGADRAGSNYSAQSVCCRVPGH